MNAEIQQRQAARDAIAAATAAYEKAHGKVKTTPIMRRDAQGHFMQNSTVRENKSRKRAGAKTTAVQKAAKAVTPLRKRGTKQAKANELLREEWPHSPE